MIQVLTRVIQQGTLLTGQPKEVVRKQMRAAMGEATQFGTRLVKERTPKGVMGTQGGLHSSIQPEVRETSQGVTGIIGTAYPYGLVVEKGRRPNKPRPPKGVLTRWIEMRFGATGKEAARIEFFLRRKIAKKGTKGAFMFEKTLEEDWPEFQKIFDRYGVVISRELSR